MANQVHAPPLSIQLIPPSWPLQRWGIDLVGPLPTAQGNCRFTVVAVDYFIKLIEAKPLASITSASVQKFFWQNIICRFGVPREITVDNGKQFDYIDFKEFCISLGTKIKFSSVYHPQSNGVVERASSLIFSTIKKYLFDQKKGKWVDELPRIIWSHNTAQSTATGFIPFKLLFGSEAVMPEEIKNSSYRVVRSDDTQDTMKLEKDMVKLDILQAS